MNEYRLRVELASPVLAPTVESAWQADTVFGHACWATLRAFGTGRLAAFLERYRDNDPPLVLSNGYASNTLPRPLWTRPERREREKAAIMGAMRQAKKVGDRRLVSLQDFETLRQGKRLAALSELPDIFNGLPRSHATVDRSGRVLEEAGLYALPESWTKEVTVYARADDTGLDALRALVDRLGAEGYGKRRNVGYGTVKAVSIDAFAGFAAIDGANGFVSLSNFIPAADDPTEGRWRLLAKRGKLGDEWASDDNPFKKRVTCLEAGSCFRYRPSAESETRSWYGRLVMGVAQGRTEAVQYGLAHAVPMKLPGEDSES